MYSPIECNHSSLHRTLAAQFSSLTKSNLGRCQHSDAFLRRMDMTPWISFLNTYRMSHHLRVGLTHQPVSIIRIDARTHSRESWACSPLASSLSASHCTSLPTICRLLCPELICCFLAWISKPAFEAPALPEFFRNNRLSRMWQTGDRLWQTLNDLLDFLTQFFLI